MKKSKLILTFLLILSTLLPIFSSCGECEHQWEKNGYVAKEPTDKDVGYRIFTCILCGETKSEEIPKLSHTVHDYSKNQWNSDITHHWLVCSFRDCTVTTSKGAHTLYPSSEGYTCQICMTVVNNHTFTGNIKFDESCHWTICDDENCPVICSKLPHTLDEATKCTGCEFSVSSHTQHIFSKIQWDENGHWLLCNIGGCSEATKKEAHIWIDTAEGNRACSGCGYKK